MKLMMGLLRLLLFFPLAFVIAVLSVAISYLIMTWWIWTFLVVSFPEGNTTLIVSGAIIGGFSFPLAIYMAWGVAFDD